MIGDETERRPAAAVNKATAQILKALSAYIHHPQAFGVTELSRHLGISKNMAFRALRTLEEEGFVVRDASGTRYELGFAALWLRGIEPSQEFDVRAMCRPYLQQLHALTGESVFLSVIVGRNHVTIDSVESHGLRVSHSTPGLLVPLHASPASRALIAFLSDDEIAAYLRCASPLQRFTATTITDPDALRDEIALVRRQGFARGYGDHYAHAKYISFPVLDAVGRPHAAVTVGAPPERMSEDDIERFLPEMLQIMRALNLQSRLHQAESVIIFD